MSQTPENVHRQSDKWLQMWYSKLCTLIKDREELKTILRSGESSTKISKVYEFDIIYKALKIDMQA